MYDWAVTKSHAEEELTLLCNQHQQERTNKLLPREVVLQANKKPINVVTGVSEPYSFHFSGSECELVLGNNVFRSQGARLVPLLVGGEETLVFDFRRGNLLLSAQVRDRDGNVALLIEDNELLYATDSWDIEFVGRELTLRNAPRKLRFQASFEPPSRVVVSRLDLQYGDVHAFVDARGIHVRGPGQRTRDVSNVVMHGGFEYAIVLDSHMFKAGGMLL
ncbi:hypothetical protein [Kitasatospora kazusensis]